MFDLVPMIIESILPESLVPLQLRATSRLTCSAAAILKDLVEKLCICPLDVPRPSQPTVRGIFIGYTDPLKYAVKREKGSFPAKSSW